MEEEMTIAHHEKCTRLLVQIVEQKPKFLSNPMELDRSIVEIAIEKGVQEVIRSLIISRFLAFQPFFF
jgi:hypothetical protein